MSKEIIDSVEKLEAELAKIRNAQKEFSTYTQEQVDRIFLAAAKAANMARIPLAKMAVEETGMGVVEDKIIKNHYAAEYIYNKYKDTKTCGVIEEDKAYGTMKIADQQYSKPFLLSRQETVSSSHLIQEQKNQQQPLQKSFLMLPLRQVHLKELFHGLMHLHLI